MSYDYLATKAEYKGKGVLLLYYFVKYSTCVKKAS